MNKMTSIGFGKSLPGHPDSSFMTRMKFEKPLPKAAVQALSNVLAGSYPVEVDHDGKRITIRTNGANGDNKIRLAKQALHRVGFQRFDDVFGESFPAGGGLPAETEEEFKARLDRLFGCDAKRFGFSVK